MPQQKSSKLVKISDWLIKNELVLVAITVAAIISFGVFIGWYNNKVVPVNAASIARYLVEPQNKLSFLANWDGPHYLYISQQGYSDISLTNFFPLYPLAIHVVNQVIPSVLISALLISWICLFIASYFYLKVVKEVFKEKYTLNAYRGLLLFLLFPTAMFMLVPYTEALFAALALPSLYFALKRRFLLSGILLALATTTHVTGILMIPLIALVLYEQKERFINIAVTVVIGSLGLIAYMDYLELKFHQPLAFISAQKSHGWLQHSNFSTFINQIGFVNVLFAALLIAAAIYWWRKRLSFSIYSLLFLLVPILGREVGGFNRYVLMAFPIPLMLYGITKKHSTLFTLIIVLSTALWTYFMLQYAGGYVGG